MEKYKNKAELYVNNQEDLAELGETLLNIPLDETWNTSVSLVEHDTRGGHPALRLERSRNVQWHTGRKTVESVLSELRDQTGTE